MEKGDTPLVRGLTLLAADRSWKCVLPSVLPPQPLLPVPRPSHASGQVPAITQHPIQRPLHIPATCPFSFPAFPSRAPSCHTRTLHVPHRASRAPPPTSLGSMHPPPGAPARPAASASHRPISHYAPRPISLSVSLPQCVTCPIRICASPPHAGHTHTHTLAAARVPFMCLITLSMSPQRAPSHTVGPQAVPHHALRDSSTSSLTLPAFPARVPSCPSLLVTCPIMLRTSPSRALPRAVSPRRVLRRAALGPPGRAVGGGWRRLALSAER